MLGSECQGWLCGCLGRGGGGRGREGREEGEEGEVTKFQYFNSLLSQSSLIVLSALPLL